MKLSSELGPGMWLRCYYTEMLYMERNQVARSVTVLNTTRGSTIWWQSVYLVSQLVHPTVWSDLWSPTILKPSAMLQWKSVVGKSTQQCTEDTFHRRLTNGMSLGATVADRPQAVLWLVVGTWVSHWSGARRTWELNVECHTYSKTVAVPRAWGGIMPCFTSQLLPSSFKIFKDLAEIAFFVLVTSEL